VALAAEEEGEEEEEEGDTQHIFINDGLHQ